MAAELGVIVVVPVPTPSSLPRRCGVCVCAISGCQCQAPWEGYAGSMLFHLARPGECQALRHARDAQYLRLLISVCRAPARPAELVQAAAAGVSAALALPNKLREGAGGAAAGGWGGRGVGGAGRAAEAANGRAVLREVPPPAVGEWPIASARGPAASRAGGRGARVCGGGGGQCQPPAPPPPAGGRC